MKYLRSFIRFIKRPCYMFKYFKKVNKVIEAVEGKDKQELGFVNDNGVWYVDLPEWELDRGHLMMVAGADTLLDMMSNYGLGRVEIDITACNDGEEAVDIAEETKGADVILELINTDIGGLSGDRKSVV